MAFIGLRSHKRSDRRCSLRIVHKQTVNARPQTHAHKDTRRHRQRITTEAHQTNSTKGAHKRRVKKRWKKARVTKPETEGRGERRNGRTKKCKKERNTAAEINSRTSDLELARRKTRLLLLCFSVNWAVINRCCILTTVVVYALP